MKLFDWKRRQADESEVRRPRAALPIPSSSHHRSPSNLPPLSLRSLPPFSQLNDVENTLFTLDNLKSSPGSLKRVQRKGRGIAAGQGASCGFGMRGQKSRSGRPTRPGFEGGQQPLYRRLPKFQGKPLGPGHKRTIYNLIKTSELNSLSEGSFVNYSSLLEGGTITKGPSKLGHKVVVGREVRERFHLRMNVFDFRERKTIVGR